MVLMPGFQSTRLVTEGALEPFFFLYTDDSIQGNTETCKQSSIMLNYEVKNTTLYRAPHGSFRQTKTAHHTGSLHMELEEAGIYAQNRHTPAD